MFWVSIAVVFFIGFAAGVFLMCLMVMASRGEHPKDLGGGNGQKKAKDLAGLDAERRLIAIALTRVR